MGANSTIFDKYETKASTGKSRKCKRLKVLAKLLIKYLKQVNENLKCCGQIKVLSSFSNHFKEFLKHKGIQLYKIKQKILRVLLRGGIRQ